MCWKDWIMMDYGKTKKYRMKINVSIRKNRFIDIDCLTFVDSLISTFVTQSLDLFNHNQWERKGSKRTWSIKAQALQILWDSVHILTRQLTSIITERTYSFLEQKELLPREQKGCRNGSCGYKDLLLINRMNIENFHKKKRNLSIAWIDYRKAFDSLPHSWMLKVVDIYKVSLVTIDVFRSSVKLWNTNLFLNHAKGFMKSDKININCGIFLVDSYPHYYFVCP